MAQAALRIKQRPLGRASSRPFRTLLPNSPGSRPGFYRAPGRCNPGRQAGDTAV